MDMSSDICPNCHRRGGVTLLSTTNQWKYHCEKCDCRFNEKREILDASKN